MKHAIKHLHFVGVGGSGMSGIAEILYNLGYKVSGSDQSDSATLQRLKSLGIATFVGHAAKHIAGADAVKELRLVQERLDLEAELATMGATVDMSALEAEFIKQG